MERALSSTDLKGYNRSLRRACKTKERKVDEAQSSRIQPLRPSQEPENQVMFLHEDLPSTVSWFAIAAKLSG